MQPPIASKLENGRAAKNGCILALCEATASWRSLRKFTEIILIKRLWGTETRFLWLRKDSLQTYFNNSLWRKLRHSFLPKTGCNVQTLPCKGVVRQPLVTLRKVHLEAQNDDFFQTSTPIWVSIDLNGHSHKTIQYSSICKPCTKGMPGDSLARNVCLFCDVTNGKRK